MFEQELARDATTLAVRRHFPEDDRRFYWRPLAGNAHGWSTGEQIESFISGTASQVGRFADAAEPLGPMAALFSAASLEAAAEALPGRQPALEAALGEAHPESVEAAEVLTADAAPPMDEPAPAIPRHLKRLERGPPDRHHADGPLAPGAPWARAADDVCIDLEVDPAEGLSASEAARRLVRHGPNRLREHARRSTWAVLLDQFKSLIIALLGAAAGRGVPLRRHAGGVGHPRRDRAQRRDRLRHRAARRALDGGALRARPRDDAGPPRRADRRGRGRRPRARRRRRDRGGGRSHGRPPGRRGVEAPGRRVGPDGGERAGSASEPEAVPAEALLAERASMLYKGTAVTRGAGLGVVTGTGMATELGAISALVEEADAGATPLEDRLARLGRTLIGVTLAVAAFVAVSGVLAGKDVVLMIETGIALAVAAVPEGLPVVATIALARGVRRMAQRNALLNRLAAVETLGSTGVILTDKTGTLTENRMTATRLVVASGPVDVTGEGLALEGGIWCGTSGPWSTRPRTRRVPGAAGDRRAMQQRRTRDPAGEEVQRRPPAIRWRWRSSCSGPRRGCTARRSWTRRPEVREEAFDPDVKMMATFHAGRERLTGWRCKGGPGAVLDACTHERARRTAPTPR